jgi:hypothetical protein
LDAQNAGNSISRGFQQLLSPSNILSHRKVPFQKMPPHGKILKKSPDTYYRSIHVFFMQELYFEEFISFAALFFIYEHLKPPASAFHDFNKE